jgi:hypothetical protein
LVDAFADVGCLFWIKMRYLKLFNLSKLRKRRSKMKSFRILKQILITSMAAMLCSCAVGSIQLKPFSIQNHKQIGRSLVIEPIEFRYDDPNLQPHSHVCLRSTIPLMLWSETGRGCFGSAFLIHPSKIDNPELIPANIADCIQQSLQASKMFDNVSLKAKYDMTTRKTPLVLRGEIKECREVGYATSYGLSFVGSTICIVIPIIPTNYGNHIKFAMDLQLVEPDGGKILWEGQIKGESPKRIRFFWQMRDVVHGTNDFDQVLARCIQVQLPAVMDKMVAAAEINTGT